MMLSNKILFYLLHLRVSFFFLLFQSVSVRTDVITLVVVLEALTCHQFYAGISNYCDCWKYVRPYRLKKSGWI